MSKISKVYLDHNATTPLHPAVLERLPQALVQFGNPSSIHWAGQASKTILRETRRTLAKAMGVHPLEIIFTSGGTESNNTILRSLTEPNSKGSDAGETPRREIITSQVEHPSVAKVLEAVEAKGWLVHRIAVSRDGVFDWEHFSQVLSERTRLVSIMAANNEAGMMLPLQKIAAAAKAVGAFVHADCVQLLGKVALSELHSWNLDYASFSGHKVYALKGGGFTYVRRGSPYAPLLLGGAQERSRRGGTENSLAIASLGFVLPHLDEIVHDQQNRIRSLRNDFETQLLTTVKGVKINGTKAERLPNTSSLVIDDVDGESLLMSLDLEGFAVSTGAACSSGSPEPSPVLLAMGLSRREAQSSLRVSFGTPTTATEVQSFLQTLERVVLRLRQVQAKATLPKKECV